MLPVLLIQMVSISEVVFKLLDAANQVVAEKSDKEAPFVQEFTVPCDSPQYTVKTVVIDSKGAQSSPADCTQTVTVAQAQGWTGRRCWLCTSV